MAVSVKSAVVWARSVSRLELAMVIWAVAVFLGFLTTLGMVIFGIRELWLVYVLIGLVAGILPPKLYFQFRAIRPQRRSADS